MQDDSRQDTKPDSNGCKKDPAPQPHNPGTDCKPPTDSTTPPKAPDPPKCETCCDCPPTSVVDPTCLEDLIEKETSTANEGDDAKKFKAELEALLAKVKTASAEYTPETYKDLVERWKTEDKLLVELIRKLICAVPCWWCVIECEICPLITAVRDAEWRLNGTGARYTTADTLYDERYWWWRERERRSEAFERIKKVMMAWEKPFATIDGVLKANAEAIKAAGSVLAPDIPKLLYEVFFRIVPLHLAIAPPKEVATTNIEKKYVELCPCDKPGTPDDCCGPNVGVPSVRDRLIGPQPYLIAPDLYPKLICCLATNVYRPAKDALARANAEFSKLDAKIERLKAEIVARIKALPADAKIRLGKPIDCNNYKPKSKSGEGGGDSKCCGGSETGGSATPTDTRKSAF